MLHATPERSFLALAYMFDAKESAGGLGVGQRAICRPISKTGVVTKPTSDCGITSANFSRIQHEVRI